MSECRLKGVTRIIYQRISELLTSVARQSVRLIAIGWRFLGFAGAARPLAP